VYNFAHTYQPTLNVRPKLSPWIADRGWLSKTFLLLRLNHEFTKWGRLRRNGSSPEVGPSDCVSGLVYQGSHPKQPRPRLNQMKIQEGDSWSRLGKLGPGGCHCRASCGCTLSLGSRGENSGPRVGKNESNNHIPCGGPSKPLSMFIIPPLITDHITFSFHTRFICSSDSSTRWIKLQQLSMAKQYRNNGSSNAHKRKPSLAGRSGSGILRDND